MAPPLGDGEWTHSLSLESCGLGPMRPETGGGVPPLPPLPPNPSPSPSPAFSPQRGSRDGRLARIALRESESPLCCPCVVTFLGSCMANNHRARVVVRFTLAISVPLIWFIACA